MTTLQYKALVCDLLISSNEEEPEKFYWIIKNALIICNNFTKKKTIMDFIRLMEDEIYLQVDNYDMDKIKKALKLLDIFRVIHTMKIMMRSKFKYAWNYELSTLIPEYLNPKDFDFDKIPYLTKVEKVYLVYELNNVLDMLDTSIRGRLRKDCLDYCYIQTVKLLIELYEENTLNDSKLKVFT